MAILRDNRFTRVVRQDVLAVDVPNSACIVDLRIDPSQQFQIRAVQFGYRLQSATDRGNFLFGTVLGLFDVATELITGLTISTILATGEIFFEESITSNTETVKTVVLHDSLRLNGDRKVAFVLLAPIFSAAIASNVFFTLNVIGEATQIPSDEKPRLGAWEIR